MELGFDLGLGLGLEGSGLGLGLVLCGLVNIPGSELLDILRSGQKRWTGHVLQHDCFSENSVRRTKKKKTEENVIENRRKYRLHSTKKYWHKTDQISINENGNLPMDRT